MYMSWIHLSQDDLCEKLLSGYSHPVLPVMLEKTKNPPDQYFSNIFIWNRIADHRIGSTCKFMHMCYLIMESETCLGTAAFLGYSKFTAFSKCRLFSSPYSGIHKNLQKYCDNYVLVFSLQLKKLKMIMKKTFPLVELSYNNLNEYRTYKNYSSVCDIKITVVGLCKNRTIVNLWCLTLSGQ